MFWTLFFIISLLLKTARWLNFPFAHLSLEKKWYWWKMKKWKIEKWKSVRNKMLGRIFLCFSRTSLMIRELLCPRAVSLAVRGKSPIREFPCEWNRKKKIVITNRADTRCEIWALKCSNLFFETFILGLLRSSLLGRTNREENRYTSYYERRFLKVGERGFIEVRWNEGNIIFIECTRVYLLSFLSLRTA